MVSLVLRRRLPHLRRNTFTVKQRVYDMYHEHKVPPLKSSISISPFQEKYQSSQMIWLTIDTTSIYVSPMNSRGRGG